MSILLRSGGEGAMFAGDVLHHPIQLRQPEWYSVFCAAPEQALISRRWALDYAAEQRLLYFSSHFGGTSAGTVSREGGEYRWEFV